MFVVAKIDFIALLTIQQMDCYKTKLKANSYVKMYKHGKVGVCEVWYLVYGMGKV